MSSVTRRLLCVPVKRHRITRYVSSWMHIWLIWTNKPQSQLFLVLFTRAVCCEVLLMILRHWSHWLTYKKCGFSITEHYLTFQGLPPLSWTGLFRVAGLAAGEQFLGQQDVRTWIHPTLSSCGVTLKIKCMKQNRTARKTYNGTFSAHVARLYRGW